MPTLLCLYLRPWLTVETSVLKDQKYIQGTSIFSVFQLLHLKLQNCCSNRTFNLKVNSWSCIFMMNNFFKEEMYPKPKLRLFYALSQNCQYIFEKQYDYLEANWLRTQKGHLSFTRPTEQLLSYWSVHAKYCFDQ